MLRVLRATCCRALPGSGAAAKKGFPQQLHQVGAPEPEKTLSPHGHQLAPFLDGRNGKKGSRQGPSACFGVRDAEFRLCSQVELASKFD